MPCASFEYPPRDSVRFVNSAPKYSLQALPGDDWEVRLTKAIIRNISWLKDEQGITTEQLARRCDEFLGTSGATKTSTLNGLFAGKRKTISVPEVIMFATALSVPVMALLAPSRVQEIEVRPGSTMNPVAALRTMVGIEAWLWGPPNPLHMWHGSEFPPQSSAARATETIVQHWRAEDTMFSAMAELLDGIEREADPLILSAYLASTQNALREYHWWGQELARHALQPPRLPEFLNWVPQLDPAQLTLDFARGVLAQRTAELSGIQWKTGSDDATPSNTAQ